MSPVFNLWVLFCKEFIDFVVQLWRLEWTNMDPTQFTILRDVKRLWNALNVIGLGNPRTNIRTIEIGQVELFHVSERLFFRIHPVDPDKDHALILVLPPGLF